MRLSVCASQVRFLEAEVDRPAPPAGRRPRATPAASSSGWPTPSARWPAVTSQNERLAQTLREARDQIMNLKEEVDRLAQPPAGFGTFLQPQRGRLDRRVHRRPQAAGQRQPERRPRRAAPRPGGHAQRGAQRRRRARLREGRRGRDVQGAARRRRPRPGHRQRRRGARRTPRRAAAHRHDPRRRLAAARRPRRLRLREGAEVRGRGAGPRRGPRHRLLRRSAAW